MEPKGFEQLLSLYQAIKDKHVNPRLDFYTKGVESKRRAAEYSGATILLLSLVIPVVANLPFKPPSPWDSMIVSILSLVIAFISGIRELTQWARLWREYSQAKIQIETLIGAWEIEIARARQLTDLTKVTNMLEKATTTLLASVDNIVLAEMSSFFAAATRAPQAQGHGEQTAAK